MFNMLYIVYTNIIYIYIYIHMLYLGMCPLHSVATKYVEPTDQQLMVFQVGTIPLSMAVVCLASNLVIRLQGRSCKLQRQAMPRHCSKHHLPVGLGHRQQNRQNKSKLIRNTKIGYSWHIVIVVHFLDHL